MIVSLKGKLADVADNTVVIDVGGIGYEVIVTGAVLRSLPPLGRELQLYTYLHVRDDAMLLYGFPPGRKEICFMRLLELRVSGRKRPLQFYLILALWSLSGLFKSASYPFSPACPGLAKKTGERILLELKDKFKDGGLGPQGGKTICRWRGGAAF